MTWSMTDEEVNGSKGRQLQWAAFFGNCEHEVSPVTVGYRCTLTYNLYQQALDEAHVKWWSSVGRSDWIGNTP